jgi:hypothetical protein
MSAFALDRCSKTTLVYIVTRGGRMGPSWKGGTRELFSFGEGSIDQADGEAMETCANRHGAFATEQRAQPPGQGHESRSGAPGQLGQHGPPGS